MRHFKYISHCSKLNLSKKTIYQKFKMHQRFDTFSKNKFNEKLTSYIIFTTYTKMIKSSLGMLYSYKLPNKQFLKKHYNIRNEKIAISSRIQTTRIDFSIKECISINKLLLHNAEQINMFCHKTDFCKQKNIKTNKLHMIRLFKPQTRAIYLKIK